MTTDPEESKIPFFEEKEPLPAPPDGPEGPPSPAASSLPPPPPEKPFVGRFFFWLFAFAIPVDFAASVVSTYVHEFAHGLTALATGGYFLGIKDAR